jgi:uncharacterized membrane protein
MNVTLWVLQGILALAYLLSGVLKLARSKEQLAAQMRWVEGFPPNAIKAIGLVEILGALGLILPALTGVAPWLTPLAGAGLALDMLVASLVHIRLKEYSLVSMTAVLLIMAAFVAYGRFFVRPL